MSRGRPAGSVKPEHRRRRDYRFSPATLRLLEHGKAITGVNETAFVEAAIGHYLAYLNGERSEQWPAGKGGEDWREVSSRHEREREPALRFPGISREQIEAQVEPETVPVSRPAPAPEPGAPSLRQPVYQIYVRHEPGVCPALPEGFSYVDGDQSTGRRPCAQLIHRVLAQPIGIEAARRRAEQLQTVAGVHRVWILDRKGGQKDSWRKEAGRWVRDD